jgi:hypothetical protein
MTNRTAAPRGVVAASPHLAVIDHEGEFDFGLSLLIAGLENYVRHATT